MSHKGIPYKTGSFYIRRKKMIEKWEKNLIITTLAGHQGNLVKSAKSLEMSYGVFYLLLKRHGMKTRNGKVEK